MPDGSGFGPRFVDNAANPEAEGGEHPFEAFGRAVEEGDQGREPAPDVSTEDEFPEDAEFPSDEELAEGEQPSAETEGGAQGAEGGEPSQEGTPPEAGQEQQPLLAGRYQTQQQLEDGYRALQAEYTRNQQQFLAQQQQTAAMQQQMAQQQQALDELMQLQYLQLQESNPEAAAQMQQQMESQRLIEERIQQGIEQNVAPIREDVLQQQVVARAQGAIMEFYRRHPDVTPRGPEDVQLAQTVAQLRNNGVPIDLTDIEHIEIAHEATRDPSLAFQLSMNPRMVLMPGLVENWKHRANESNGTPPANGNGGAQSGARGPVRRRVDAAVETGGSGAPVPTAPGSKPGDEFDEAFEAFVGTTPASPLFGNRR